MDGHIFFANIYLHKKLRYKDIYTVLQFLSVTQILTAKKFLWMLIELETRSEGKPSSVIPQQKLLLLKWSTYYSQMNWFIFVYVVWAY